MGKKYVIGVDFGTDSVRSVIVDSADGTEISSDVFLYSRWAKNLYCDPGKNQFRQHPLDYLDGLQLTIRNALEASSPEISKQIVGISVDTTGSTPIAVDDQGVALSLREEFKDNPNAMFVLWKDHTAIKEADEINQLARTWGGEDFTAYSGGSYSTEWFWSKILHILRVDQQVAEHAYSWVEHCDWLPALLTGTNHPTLIKRSRCAAGHKAMWHKKWGGLPSERFLEKLDPLLNGIRDRLYTDTFTSDNVAGYLTQEWAENLGLSQGVPVSVGAIDAHMGAVGAQIKPYSLVKVMGTSTCDMVTAPEQDFDSKRVRGICGQVDGSIIPGLTGMEAGQSAFGDIYTWFKELISWPLSMVEESALLDKVTAEKLVAEISDQILPELSKAAMKIPINSSGEMAIDWLNGRRTPDLNPELKGALFGLSLGSDAPKIFKALVEASVFGSRKILECFVEEGVKIRDVIAIGGVAKKSPLVMQVLADVLNMEIKVAKSEQTVALGAAMFAAVAAGVYETIEDAQDSMGAGFEKSYHPIPENVIQYEKLYEMYEKAGCFIEQELVA